MHQERDVSTKKSNPHREMLAARRKRDRLILRRSKTESHQAIADDLGMTRQRVGQILAKHAAAAASEA